MLLCSSARLFSCTAGSHCGTARLNTKVLYVYCLRTWISLPSPFNSWEQSRKRKQRNRRWPLRQWVKQHSSFLPFTITGEEWTGQTPTNCSFSRTSGALRPIGRLTHDCTFEFQLTEDPQATNAMRINVLTVFLAQSEWGSPKISWENELF